MMFATPDMAGMSERISDASTSVARGVRMGPIVLDFIECPSFSASQEAPRVLIVSNRRRAIARLAKPNSDNSCAVFLARPR